MSDENQDQIQDPVVDEGLIPPEPEPGYAILKVGIGCRAVASRGEITEDENFSLYPQNGYAVRNDGKGWRAVAAETEVGTDETFTLEQPELLTPNQTLMQIYALEAQITPRRMRESILGTDAGWLSDIEQQIDTLRSQLP